MGGSGSRSAAVPRDELEKREELKIVSNFTDAEVIRLIKIFNDLDVDQSGAISREELFEMPQFKANPFLPRIMKISDESGDDVMDIKEFAKLMSVFSIRATREQKLRYAFKVYDVDGDDKISTEDLTDTLLTLTESKMDQEAMKEVIENVFREADGDGDGFIQFEDFSKVVLNTDIEGKLTMEF